MKSILMLTILSLGLITIDANDFHLSQQEKKSLDSLSDGIEKFSWNLILRSGLDVPNGNVILSPFSVWSMMSVLAEGAHGITLKELEKVLRHPKNYKSVIRDGFKAIRRSLSQISHIEYIDLNTIFYDDQVVIKKSFQNLINDVFFTRVFPVDFENSTTVKFVNNYFNINTDGRINSIVLEEDLKKAQMIAMNGVYFEGRWSVPFNKRLTRIEPFYDETKKIIGNVKMMTAKGMFYNVDSKLLKSQIVEIPYGLEDKLSMLLIIPNDGVKLVDVYNKFTEFKIKDLFSEYLTEDILLSTSVELKMPKICITTDLVLNSILNNMGIFEIFDPKYSDLSTMASTPLCLSRVIHKTKIQLDENGTERSPLGQNQFPNRTPLKIVANKPFIFLIIEKTCKFIVLGGIYREPESF